MSPPSRTPRLVVSVGCPAGIGPEVSIVAGLELTSHVLLVGDEGALRQAAALRGIADDRLKRVSHPDEAWALPERILGIWQPTPALKTKDIRPGSPSRRGGAAQLSWIDDACDLVSGGSADALITGPVSKEAIVRSGAETSALFRGHTEHLQHRLGAREVVMVFWTDRLSTALVTTHLPIAKVSRAITPAAIARTSFWLSSFMAQLVAGHRVAKGPPRVVVAGLNPHAGEGGLIGTEEVTRFAAGIALAKQRLAQSNIHVALSGPIAAESAWRLAAAGQFDGVVAMYHDQATIPMKLLGFGEAVNVSLALPIVRTSVDHGTAYDRAGLGTADAGAMLQALRLAERLAAERLQRRRSSAESLSTVSK